MGCAWALANAPWLVPAGPGVAEAGMMYSTGAFSPGSSVPAAVSLSRPTAQAANAFMNSPGAKQCVAAAPTFQQTINGIKALPNGATLTAEQIAALGKNVDLLLNKSLPASVASGNQTTFINTILNDSRFRFLDQVPGAFDKLDNALAPYVSFLRNRK